MKLCVIILNYRRGHLTIDCLRTLRGEIEGFADRCAICIDNASDDGSADAIEAAIRENQWEGWLRFVRSPVNRGFAGGNNLGFQSVGAENYLLLNSDTRMLPGSIGQLLDGLDRHPNVGAIGPRLQSPQGEAQISCFRYRTPITELLDAAGTGPLDRLFSKYLVPMGIFDQPMEPQWLSFACIMIRRAVIDQIGLMDEDYFMYFEDIDYSREIRRAGWRILHVPDARVVHLRGGTSSVKAAIKARRRVPKYYYESRSRYFAKFYGGMVGLWMTNFMWLVGRTIALCREVVGNKTPGACELEARDNWTNWIRPLRAPQPQKGGEL
ncbi:MAG: glycosyltransferase family 2 protein [Phycisphaerales bacterium]|nr:glycosyltransferase family 2 protein [Phycisphaerales bacterium]